MDPNNVIPHVYDSIFGSEYHVPTVILGRRRGGRDGVPFSILKGHQNMYLVFFFSFALKKVESLSGGGGTRRDQAFLESREEVVFPFFSSRLLFREVFPSFGGGRWGEWNHERLAGWLAGGDGGRGGGVLWSFFLIEDGGGRLL